MAKYILTKLGANDPLVALIRYCYFSGRFEIQDGRQCLWLAEIFSTCLCKWYSLRPDQVLLGIFEFFSRTVMTIFHQSLCKWFSLRPDQVLLFLRPIQNPRWPPLPLMGILHFQQLLTNGQADFDQTWHKWSSIGTDHVLLYFMPIRNPRWPPWPLTRWDIIDFFHKAEFNHTWYKLSSCSPETRLSQFSGQFVLGLLPRWRQYGVKIPSKRPV